MKIKIVLEWENKQYELYFPYSSASDYHSICFSWEEDNLSCDCNRAMLIQTQRDPKFPEFQCGDSIKLISLTNVK